MLSKRHHLRLVVPEDEMEEFDKLLDRQCRVSMAELELYHQHDTSV